MKPRHLTPPEPTATSPTWGTFGVASFGESSMVPVKGEKSLDRTAFLSGPTNR